jgi:glutamate 5-kinase
MIDADILLLLSDVDAFVDLDGKIVPVITALDSSHCKAVRKKSRAHTRGGMLSKLRAADLAATLGIRTVIAHGRSKEIITKIVVEGSKVGTHFQPRAKVSGKKRWIAFSRKTKGRIVVDAGAEKALVERSGSLLSKGIKAVEGDFSKGDTVDIVSQKGLVIGRGLANYDSDHLQENIGQKLSQEVVHRDNLVIEKWLGFSHDV